VKKLKLNVVLLCFLEMLAGYGAEYLKPRVATKGRKISVLAKREIS
jgi:hypothetical protein